jgi:hypothetical protein
MPRYVVERTFPEGLYIPVETTARTVAHRDQRNAEENVTWLHSYVSDDKRRTFCVCDAPSPKAILKADGRNAPPVEPDYPGTGARPLLLQVRCLRCVDHRRP